MSFNILFYVAITSITACMFYMMQKRKSEKQNHIEALKNALLSHLLIRVFKDKIDDFPGFNYQDYDGTKLPTLSGANLSHALYSYIVPTDILKTSIFYTPTMEHKVLAIEKFIQKNIPSEEIALDVLDKYIYNKDEKSKI